MRMHTYSTGGLSCGCVCVLLLKLSTSTLSESTVLKTWSIDGRGGCRFLCETGWFSDGNFISNGNNLLSGVVVCKSAARSRDMIAIRTTFAASTLLTLHFRHRNNGTDYENVYCLCVRAWMRIARARVNKICKKKLWTPVDQASN